MDTTQVAPAPLEQSYVHVLIPDDFPTGTVDASTCGVYDSTHVVADAGCGSPTDDSNIEGTSPAYTRKSTRRAQDPVWLKDYVTTKKANFYSLPNYLSYDATSPKYKAYLANFSTLVEPKCFNEAVQDTRWVEAMKL
ncbi:hypothetical protein KY290_024697 [Solanum tuberosum]|uniref:Integrase core domain containing protein n=1 Tax=Solanum tuberosum TaxID=4113 RepID=A0ABQ7URF0_SOLTU|nr:hypothetical protein KY284_023548 [Solanum tuberosum]KAH0754427.1 hypothetical protein KY290_024697 [Solanum tuberosum]